LKTAQEDLIDQPPPTKNTPKHVWQPPPDENKSANPHLSGCIGKGLTPPPPPAERGGDTMNPFLNFTPFISPFVQKTFPLSSNTT